MHFLHFPFSPRNMNMQLFNIFFFTVLIFGQVKTAHAYTRAHYNNDENLDVKKKNRSRRLDTEADFVNRQL